MSSAAARKPHLNMIVVGHIDNGKSTTMGHFLMELGLVDERTIAAHAAESEKTGKGDTFKYAWVMDNIKDERERGITIDLAFQKFESPKYFFTRRPARALRHRPGGGPGRTAGRLGNRALPLRAGLGRPECRAGRQRRRARPGRRRYRRLWALRGPAARSSAPFLHRHRRPGAVPGGRDGRPDGALPHSGGSATPPRQPLVGHLDAAAHGFGSRFPAACPRRLRRPPQRHADCVLRRHPPRHSRRHALGARAAPANPGLTTALAPQPRRQGPLRSTSKKTKGSFMDRHALCVAALAALCLQDAHAGPDEYVFMPAVEYGEREIDFKAGTARGPGDDRATAESIGFGMGVTQHWFTEIYAKVHHETGESREFDAIEWENKFQLTEPGEYPVDIGLIVEVERPQNHDEGWEALVGALFQKDFGKLQVNANLLLERHFDAAEKSETDLGYQWQLKYRLTPAFAFGAQGFGEVGKWDDWESSHEQEHKAGPAVFGKLPLGDHQALVYNAAYLWGLSDATPGHTVRMQVEYEF